MLTESDIIKLTEVYSKEHLLANVLPLVKRFIHSGLLTAEMLDIPLVHNANQAVGEKRIPSKPELGRLCFFIFYNEEIFQAFLKSMPVWFGQLLEKLVWQKDLQREEVEKIVGQQIVSIVSFSSNYEYLPELKFFTIQTLGGHFYNGAKTWQQAYAAKPVVFSLPMPFKMAIADFYPKPEGYYITATNEFDNTPKSNVFDAEADILQVFSPLVSYYLQGNIKYSERGRPNIAGLKKVQKTLALKEFYDDSNLGLHPVRTMLVLGMLHSLTQKDMLNDTPSSIKKIFTDHFINSKHPSVIANFIINQVKGIGYLSDYDYSNEAAPIFWNLINDVPTNGWITWKNIAAYLQSHFLEPQPVYGNNLHKLYFEDSDKDRVQIDNQNRIPLLQWAFIKGAIFLFAAFGLVKIAFTKPDTKELGKTWFSEYDGLQAFQLTGLGKFVLGKTSSYEPPVIENESTLIFDEDDLMIRTEGNLDLMSTLLGNYVEKISANSFVFRPDLFLKDCKNVKQIENKIALFRKSLSVKLPAFWEAELKRMVTNALAVIQQIDFFVFKLNETDKQLLRTIAQDNQLKAIAIKAEKFYVLVDKKNKAAFKNRLMELGYFVEA